ncbi:DnaJ-domain-containing protein [Xylariaceae sp. AK1471]|nr:DnaJ-domain-containing protein [Xylariaceae sp. AK1471]
MPARSAVSLLAASAPTQRQCLCFFLYPSPALFPLRKPGLTTTSSQRQHHGFPKVNVRRPFHSTAARRDDTIDNARNHYETLKISPSASESEIKKSFYNLSKTHHPDLHEVSKRRAAAKRFMRISEAYSILSSPTKRAKYDREHMNIAHSAHAAHAHRKGSYASTGPAGGRPASGLSRRRGTFHGPPPSFFRSGGWGAQGEKRKAAHEDSTGGAASGSGSGARNASGKGTMGGMGPGQDPFGHRDDVPHFDKESHERTGRNIDRRREARRGVENDLGERIPIEPERGVMGMFFVISGVLLLSFAGPFFIGRLLYGGDQKLKEKGKDTGKG